MKIFPLLFTFEKFEFQIPFLKRAYKGIVNNLKNYKPKPLIKQFKIRDRQKDRDRERSRINSECAATTEPKSIFRIDYTARNDFCTLFTLRQRKIFPLPEIRYGRVIEWHGRC